MATQMNVDATNNCVSSSTCENSRMVAPMLWLVRVFCKERKTKKLGEVQLCGRTRRKQKWSTDPRNSAWSNDDSKFGQKMLERMGWSKGKGLGRSEQGATEHVQVKVKNNCYGLGAQGSQEDNWIAHQEDFNDLLAQLNNCHGRNNNSSSSSSSNAESPPELLQKGFSLEEKSKTSKKRVHYMKFAKGKDLSSRSATDLNCIFGKRAKCAAHPEQEKRRRAADGTANQKCKFQRDPTGHRGERREPDRQEPDRRRRSRTRHGVHHQDGDQHAHHAGVLCAEDGPAEGGPPAGRRGRARVGRAQEEEEEEGGGGNGERSGTSG
ncbi:PIN2/TERF1-interacting telomerase inhibitor 1 isoform X3 [Phyllopteryx taeniolatus]|uniref:PIN2/TERF1-interacting telomerase inhibitor 1 isoform X3 n=1 Tax=Phyllopteryx taeniolatus TaxID=161469 RepID=UPI002AD4A56A|nr:PIN2/TERF1-interacting telomerase inhibitor 1 isoform X3 [Phyllopteryx taeniolatus]